MRKNWLARAETNTIRNGARRFGAAWAGAFRRRPLVPDSAFQDAGEPYPGHWRHFPARWRATDAAQRTAVQGAVHELPSTWRRVLLNHDALAHSDAQIAADLGLSLDQERDILTAARAAVRDRLDGVRPIRDER
jgi:DNA-directed RNA polymerase specialized sigma24 family protein